ncbi:MAG: SAF domain-containing protein [Promethearchaeota archaeon]
MKYGESIGIATKNINRGDWIHTHNLTSQYLIEVLKK